MRKIFAGAVGLVLLILLSGAVYQRYAERRDAEMYPMPGQRIDVGERSLHLFCSGTGDVTVLLESGLTAPFAVWRAVQERISKFARVCSYDRAGLGWSDLSPNPTRIVHVVDDLSRLLVNAHIDGPLLLVGWSAGGVYAQSFAVKYPGRVKGIVLVDSSHESQGLRMPPDPGLKDSVAMLQVCRVLAPVGIVRILGAMESILQNVDLPDAFRMEQIALFNRTSYCPGVLREIEGFPRDVLHEESDVSLGAIPLIVITRGKQLTLADVPADSSQDVVDAMNGTWSQLQDELATRSTHAEHWFASQSGHSIPYDQPEIIVRAVQQLLEASN